MKEICLYEEKGIVREGEIPQSPWGKDSKLFEFPIASI